MTATDVTADATDQPVDEAPGERFDIPFRVDVQPGLLVTSGLLLFVGALLRGATEVTAWGIVSYTVVFTAVLMALIAVHELGHAVVGMLCGHRWTGIKLGMGFAVTLFGEHTRKTTFFTASAGPVFGALASSAVIFAAEPWSPMWAAGWVALADNVANVALFFVPAADGAKIVGSLIGKIPARETA